MDYFKYPQYNHYLPPASYNNLDGKKIYVFKIDFYFIYLFCKLCFLFYVK